MRFYAPIIVFAISVLLSLPAAARTLTVGGSSSAFHSITDALATAQAGDTIIVKAGHYEEPELRIGKSLRVIGEGNPVLDGCGKHTLISVRSDNVSISGLVLENTGTSYVEERAAINVSNCKNIRVQGNKLLRCLFGVYLAGCEDSLVADNQIVGMHASETASGNGIHMWHCKRMQIERNNVSGQRDGIYLEFVDNSRIINNISHNNARYGMHFMFSNTDTYLHNVFDNNGAGVAVMYSKHVDMENNLFTHNWGAASYGLLIKELSDGAISHCTFDKNTTGLQCDGAARMDIRGNDFLENGRAVRIVSYSADNRFSNNNFVGNTFDLVASVASDTNTFERNFWDRNQGYDLNHDGITDVPYRPVRASSTVVENYPAAAFLVRSPLLEVLDLAEEAFPTLAPPSLCDKQPLMRKIKWTNISSR